MDFDYYQDSAAETDQFGSGLLIPLLGLAGETGTLLAEFKKKIRDKESYEGFKGRAEEELGDVLWYLSNISSRLGLSLSEIAAKNLHKTQERWPIPNQKPESHLLFDEASPPREQFPRNVRVQIFQNESGGRARMRVYPDGRELGDALTDNAYRDDGYRFHDVMHLANMAVLGWSPVMRSLFKLKRKSQPKVDEVEDGARAIVLEEAVVAFIYSNAKERRYYEKIRHVDSEMLATVKRIVTHVEVATRKTKDWERSILKGYAAFRHLLKNGQGLFELDLPTQDLLIVQ